MELLPYYYYSFLWTSSISDLYRMVSGFPKGLMNYFYHGLTANVIANTVNLSDEEVAQLKEKPAYISAFDMT